MENEPTPIEWTKKVHPVAIVGAQRCHYARALEAGHRTECGLVIAEADRDPNPGRLQTCQKCDRSVSHYSLVRVAAP